MFLRHPILTIATIAYLGVVAWLTLGPQPFDDSSDGLIWKALDLIARVPFLHWVTYAGVEFTGNVLMFLPVGMFFLLLLGRRRWWLAVLIGVAMTITIESVQIVIPGRVSDLRDVVANSVGALIGVLLGLALTAQKARQLRERDRPVPSTAR
ncbi:MAG: VanZ family protein [Glaciihabitans sp.]|nr:VanZ family protein [Glaciihabitans sp.]MDQ1556337.1 hypothetical protein [Actinomycetota bacterium]